MNRRCPAKKLWNMISPWGEGAPFSARRTIQTHRLSTARCALFPLPEGEGQGEGKRRELPTRVSDHSRNCRTGRVLRQSRRFPEMTMRLSSTIRFFPSGPRQLREENPCWFAALVGGVLLTGAVCQVRGATITEVHAFENKFNPSSLLQTDDGSFYGTIAGATNSGMVFRIASDGSLTSFAEFNGTNGYPFQGGPLVRGLDGNFYGTTFAGGTNVFCRGTIFRLATNGILTGLVSFNGTNGWQPEAGLVLGSDGDFYGTTAYGGKSYKRTMGSPLTVPGTVFKISVDGQFTNLVSFNRTNGASPSARLVEGRDGSFYGTTVAGGTSEAGTAFQMKPDGALRTLTVFNGANGANPYGGLVLGSDGNLYGTTAHGGANGYGTVFQMTTNGLLTTLASFNGSNGAYPFSGLVRCTDGILYGTTQYGGTGYDGSINTGYGAVFGITPTGVFTTLAPFDGSHGAHSLSDLIQRADA